MLDEMMGKDRDLPPDLRKSTGPKFTDREVCKNALAGCCPYTLFPNTKMGNQLGDCRYDLHEDHLHWESVSAQWQALSDEEKAKYGYEQDLYRLLTRLVKDMDYRIKKQEEEAKVLSAPCIPQPEEQVELDSLKQQAKQVMDQSATLAEEGDIDGSMAAVSQAETLQAKYQRLHEKFTSPKQSLAVCQVCGVFIQEGDKMAQSGDHRLGKTYVGWKLIRDRQAELAEKYGPGGLFEGAANQHGDGEKEDGEVGGGRRWDPRGGGGGGGGRRRSRSRERDRGGRRRRSRSRSRSRSRERYYKRRY